MHLLSGQADRVKRWKHVCLLELRMDKLSAYHKGLFSVNIVAFADFKTFIKVSKSLG